MARWRDGEIMNAPVRENDRTLSTAHSKRCTIAGRGGATKVFALMRVGPAAEHGEETTVMIDVSTRTPCVRMSVRKYLKTHRTATSMGVTNGAWTPGSAHEGV